MQQRSRVFVALDRHNAANAARLAGLVLALGAAVAEPDPHWWAWVALAAIVILAVVLSAVLPPAAGRVMSVAEGALIAGVACSPLAGGIPVTIYLLVPPLAAGLRFGVWTAIAVTSAQYMVVICDRMLWSAAGVRYQFAWITSGLLLGILGSMIGRRFSDSLEHAYAAAAQSERQRLSRDIHDGVAQDLAVLAHKIDRLLPADTLDAPPPRVPEREVAALADETRRILQEVRWSIHDLRGGRLPEVGLGLTLTDHVQRAAAAAGMTAHLALTESASRLPGEVQLELLRVAQEAVTNARKHSGAANLWVELKTTDSSARLRVMDDGVAGLGPRDVTEGYGFAIMRERCRLMRASLHVGPRAGGGTVVEVKVRSLRPSRVPKRVAGIASVMTSSRFAQEVRT